MAYCVDAGIPHSQFLAWEPEDRAKTIAYALEKADRCISCGTSPWEWIDNPDAYAAVRQQCPGCMRREAVIEDTAADAPKGSSVVMIPHERAKEMLAHPEQYRIDGPQQRRARKRNKEAAEKAAQ